MKNKNLRLTLFALPIFGLLLFTSCSEDAPAEDTGTTEEEQPAKPLVEREPEVKEYFEVMNGIIEEYLNVGETLLTSAEKLDAGDLGLIESATAIQDLLESWDALDELEESLGQQGTIKENIESKLNAKDALEFADMYNKSLQRVDSLAQRLDSLDLEKYLE